MRIDERAIGDVRVLDLKGPMTWGPDVALFKEKIKSVVHRGHRNLVLNFQGVPSMDSDSLGAVIQAYRSLKQEGGQLKLANLQERVHTLLVTTRVLSLFETFDTEQEAVGSFSSKPG